MMRELALPHIAEVWDDCIPDKWQEVFAENKVKLYIIHLHKNGVGNGKIWPARSVIAKGVARGDHEGSDTVADSTSGNYGVSLAAAVKECLAQDKDFPVKKIVMGVPASLPEGKKRLLLDCGIELIEAKDSTDAMHQIERLSKKHGWWYTRQYWNPDNPAGYEPVARHIAHELPHLGICVWGVGSGGGCTGIMSGLTALFAERKQPLWRVAAVVEDGQKVPGVRDRKGLQPGTLPWWRYVDDIRFVGEEASMVFSSLFWQQPSVDVGPSTGFVAEATALAVRHLQMHRRLDAFRDEKGNLQVLIPAMDGRAPYAAEYRARGIHWGYAER